ncbi:hypothetical protein CRUP_003201, partial [Coryphaenoides rupestris]
MLRLTPGGADFREAVAKEVASLQQRHTQREAELDEKVAAGQGQYAALEDEFRMALTIEAARFSETKASLAQTQQRERRSSSLVQELTAMVKEQKRRISELADAKKEAVHELKGRLCSLEAEVEAGRRLSLQLELLKKDKSRLLSQLTAQESDRGRLEARVEVLATELETQKKQNEQDADGLRIKTKIIDDQTETIRKLKEGMQQRDEQIRRQCEEATKAQKSFQRQLEEDSSNKKWQEKAELLTRLEGQVKRMKDNFDSKERLLLEDRDKAAEAH